MWKLGAYLAVLGLVAAGSFALPSRPGGLVRLAILAVAIAVLVATIVRRRPPRQAGWWLVALSAFLALSEALIIVGTYGFGASERVETVPQLVLVILSLLALAAGLAILGWRNAGSGQWDVLDTTATAIGAFLLAWVFYIEPMVARSASAFATVVAISIPAASLLVFAMAVKLALTGCVSSWSGRLLLLSTAAGLATAGLLVEPIGAPTVQLGRSVLAAAVAHVILLGAAAVAPDMTRLVGDRRSPALPELPSWRLVLFVLLAVFAPVSVAVGVAQAPAPGTDLATRVVPPACGTLILLTLVLRLALVARVARRTADELSDRSASLARTLERQDELQHQLAYRAMHDPLTGLANRDVLTDRMKRLHDRCREMPERACGGQALMMVDLDGFKDVNDTHGHPVGDQILIDVAQRLIGAVRDEALVARLGGDEFAVLLEDVPAEEARRTADAIRDALRTPYFVAGREVFLSASVGLLITEPGTPAPDSSEALRDVDRALYDAKAAGRCRVVEFHPRPHVQRVQQASLTTALRYAVARNEMVLHYQPVVSLDDHRVVGVEALARWRRSGGDLVSPSEFVPIAEQTGIIVDLGAWVLRQACYDARPWHTDCGTTIGVNVSAPQLNDPTFADTVLDALARAGLPGAALVLELSESSLTATNANPAARAHLDRLRREGVRIAIDDFGSNRSSLAGIPQLPVDLVKIDSSLTQSRAGTAPPEPNWAFVRETLQAIARLDLVAIAEGIETNEQADTLRRLDCRYGQGYYFCPPVPAGQIAALLRQRSLQPV